MAQYRFVLRPRTKRTNEPLTYDIMLDNCTHGTFQKRKRNWHLQWAGVNAAFATKTELARHFGMMGHSTDGLL